MMARIGVALVMILVVALLVGAPYLAWSNWQQSKDAIIEKWLPAVLTPIVLGLFLALLVPYANHLYWERRAENERSWARRDTMRTIVADAAEAMEWALLCLDRLAALEQRESTIQEGERPEYIKARYEAEQSKLDAEKALGKVARLIEMHFGDQARTSMGDWLGLYNDRRDSPERLNKDDPLVRKAGDVFRDMRSELSS